MELLDSVTEGDDLCWTNKRARGKKIKSIYLLILIFLIYKAKLMADACVKQDRDRHKQQPQDFKIEN